MKRRTYLFLIIVVASVSTSWAQTWNHPTFKGTVVWEYGVEREDGIDGYSDYIPSTRVDDAYVTEECYIYHPASGLFSSQGGKYDTQWYLGLKPNKIKFSWKYGSYNKGMVLNYSRNSRGEESWRYIACTTGGYYVDKSEVDDVFFYIDNHFKGFFGECFWIRNTEEYYNVSNTGYAEYCKVGWKGDKDRNCNDYRIYLDSLDSFWAPSHDWMIVSVDDPNVPLYIAQVKMDSALYVGKRYGVDLVEALKVYNNSKSTTAQIDKARVTLETQTKIKRLNDARTKAPSDVSFLIASRDGASLLDWEYKVKYDFDESKWQLMYASYTNGTSKLTGNFIERWGMSNQTLGDGSLSQKLTDLPSGRYRLEADIIACQQGTTSTGKETGTYLFMESGGNRDSINTCTANNKPKCFAVEMNVTDGNLTIGFETVNSQMNWIAIDNFRLTYLGVAQVPTITFTDNVVAIATQETDATIYYTLDGTMPTDKSMQYTGPFSIEYNMTINAIAINSQGMVSDMATLKVTSFKVEDPIFEYKNFKLYITTPTEGATIYYTTNGSYPIATTSYTIQYTEPINLTETTTIKAYATKKNFMASKVVVYNFNADDVRCKTPQINRDGESNSVIISCQTEDATIYYTTDGTEPTVNSSIYNGSIPLQHNCTIQAVAMCDTLLSSQIAKYNVAWFAVSSITTEYQNGRLTLRCGTPNAEIHYEVGGTDPTTESPLYTQPIILTDNREVRFVAFAPNLNATSGRFQPTDFTCLPVTLVGYDGLHITLETTEPDAIIRYTTDGLNPSEASTEYTGKIPLTGLCTIKAIALRPYKNPSPIMEEEIKYFFDGTKAKTSESGLLWQAFEWCGTSNLEELTIEGRIDGRDLSFLQSASSLKHLHLTGAQFDNNVVPEGAFYGMNLISVDFPRNIVTLGNVFEGCRHLSSVIWTAYTKMGVSASSLGITNPNLLLYSSKAYAPEGIRNVVENGRANSIILTDESEGGFYCPTPFQAQRISYTHRYTQTTGLQECRGWETLALPFDVQTISHERVGTIAPFTSEDDTEHHFWLCALGEGGFVWVNNIKANTPYLISMPNNEAYPDDYRLAGRVTFSAVNVNIPVTQLITSSFGDRIFTPNFDSQEMADEIFVINKNEAGNNYAEGSVFIPNLRNVQPFESYIYVSSALGVHPYLSIYEVLPTRLENIQWNKEGGKIVSVFDLLGRKLSSSVLKQKGLYIINGKKYVR